jgi:hypothetical protein
MFVSFERGSAIREIHETAFSHCPLLKSIDVPQSAGIDTELLLRWAKLDIHDSAPRRILVKRQQIPAHAPVCVDVDYSSDEFWAGFEQYLSNQTK